MNDTAPEGTRLIESPPNHQRLHPIDVLKLDLEHFGAWIHYACVEWPGDLMVAGAKVRLAWEYKADKSGMERFVDDYRMWWYMDEEQKDCVISQEQRDARRRSYYRKCATACARNGFSRTEYGYIQPKGMLPRYAYQSPVGDC